MKKVCTFAGHGTITYGEEIFENLKKEIRKAIGGEGIKEFWVGNYGNFDSLAKRAVRELKKEFPSIRLCLVLPYLTKAVTEDREYYKDQFDEIILADIPRSVPKSAHIAYCNRFMVSRASLLICFVSHTFGGAAATLTYGEKAGVKIVNLAPEKKNFIT